MDTSRLISTLAADKHVARPMSFAWTAAVALAVAVAAVVFMSTIGVRPDFMDAAGTLRFPFKFVVTLALFAGSLFAVAELARPGATGAWRWSLLAAPLLLAVAVLIELMVLPSDLLSSRWLGRNWLVCLTWIPLIGIGPLAALLVALRHGAPTNPTLAGAVAGVVAGGLAATFYAAHCTDDSPLFVATWYTIAIVGLSVLGAIGGRLFARW